MVTTRTTMESQIENLEKSMLEWKHESQIQMDEIKQLRYEGSITTTAFSETTHGGRELGTRDSRRGSRPLKGDYRGRKLEILIFAGDDAYGWINRVERYFKVNDIDDYEKMGAVLVALEDRALNWYHCWVQFKEAVIRRFQPELVQNPFGPLLSIKQTGIVMEYWEKFEMISAPLKNADRVMLKGIFLNELHVELQAELKLYNIDSLSELMDRALLLEEKNWALKKKVLGSSEKVSMGEKEISPMVTKMARSILQHAGPVEPKPQNGPSGDKQITMGRRLSQAELQERSKKGLCFKCGEKWGPEHACKLKHYQLDDGDEEEEEKTELEHKTLQLSLKSKVGLTSHKSFKIWGTIGQRRVLILVDCGATNSFLSRKLVAELDLPVENTPIYTVEVGTGEKVKGRGLCKGVELKMQGVKIKQDFFLFNLGGTEVVLGMDWLADLGDIEANFRNMIIKWGDEGGKKVLKGDPSLSKAQASWKSMIKALHDGVGYYIAYQQLEDTEENQQLLSDEIKADPQGLSPRREHDHEINLKGVQIPNIRTYKYTYYQKNEIEKIVGEMLDAGIIRTSTSPYSSPVILVRKKDGGWRFCVDYRALNKLTIPDKFPIPVIDELLDEVGSAILFSKLDLKSGYHQIGMREEDIPKTAFRTHEGHYEFLVMPFGLTNAPSTFQALMNKVLKPYLRKFVLVFFDDILIYSPDEGSHQQHLKWVLQLLRENNLFANFKKCNFGQRQLRYLGHLISGKGVSADPDKVNEMVNWPVPKDLKGLRGFLGLTGYYRRFVKNYGKIAWTLTQLLKKDNFKWGNDAQQAFEQLKAAMTTLPVLAVPDFEKAFVIETDASGKGVGAVLMQEGRPIAYMSQSLSDRAQRKSKWRHYLMGSHFVVHTDQKSLRFLADQRIMGEEQQKWISKLMGFDFEIRYKPGCENRAADALSRKLQYSALSTVQFNEWDGLEDEIQANARLRGIIQDLLKQQDSHPGFQLIKGRLYYKRRMVIPKNSSKIPLILKEFHDSALGGHSGFFRTYKRISGLLFWEGMKKEIQQYVLSCAVCQQNKYQTLNPGGLLQPLPIPTHTWSDISMDFIGGLPKTQGVDTILVVVDRLTKYAHFIAIAHPYTAKDIAEIFIKDIVKLHGVFISHFWTELFKMAGTKLKFSSAYHPQTDGQTEVVNRCLETYLRCLTGAKPKQWPKWLSWAEFWYNTNYNSSTKMTPFKALYGREPPVLIRGDMIQSSVEEVNRLMADRNHMLDELKEHLVMAQNRMCKQANKHRREVEFQVGDAVYLKIQPYKLKSLAKKVNQKLSPRYYWPYEIMEKFSPAAYKLQLPAGSKVHPVFHVSALKKSIAATVTSQPLPLFLADDWELKVQPTEALAVRRNQQGDLEILIRWKDLPDFENSWEALSTIKEHFPDFHLEDKVHLVEGSVDRNPEIVRPKPTISKVYVRQRKKGKVGDQNGKRENEKNFMRGEILLYGYKEWKESGGNGGLELAGNWERLDTL
ncbi:hypothetical protein V8G54_001870 [Vigna mungo]|uniref:Ty3/gypsy retrotransposon protein n=1 Tax=Vigna mungo TaxID=3915 RepID=A0AAQ3SBX4_VIGMU